VTEGGSLPVVAAQPRQLVVDTPLGRDAFTVVTFAGEEAISRLYRFQLELVTEARAIPFEQIVGQPVTVTLDLPSETGRPFNGIVSRLTQGARSATTTQYHAEVVPWLWLLTRTTSSRVFQHVTVPDDVRDGDVLKDARVRRAGQEPEPRDDLRVVLRRRRAARALGEP